ncbi:ATP-dependent DNA helicase RecG [Lachnospiraceae bacterium TWA4]|nr:ATP-dependent DNA helicase RecG [Lachnospiraceae bacterium TWA4]
MLEDLVTSLKGVGPQTAKKLEAHAIYTKKRFTFFYPVSYEELADPKEISDIKEGQLVSIEGCFRKPLVTIKNKQALSAEFFSTGGTISILWYHMPYLKKSLFLNYTYILRGKVLKKGTRLYLIQPVVYFPEDYNKLKKTLIPIYPKMGIAPKLFRSLFKQILEENNFIEDRLPQTIRNSYRLMDLHTAYQMIHFPTTKDELLIARRRLVFDEFFFFLISVEKLKNEHQKLQASYCIKNFASAKKVLKTLPYSLTNAQTKAFKEIINDLSGNYLMNRLIQGDVGSGKTILAFLSMLGVADCGYQSALMAPTEVLARQHFEGLNKLLEENSLPFKAVLLVGSMTAKEKRLVYEQIERGNVQFIIGTHALIQEKVIYDQLALVITDEQHRFGVRQREAFSKKSRALPHVMVMSATPIPRTLALILYGDLDISIINELPANRLPIKNCAINEKDLVKAWNFLAKEVDKGHQAYVICSMVEENENIEAENVTDYYEKLQNFYKGHYRLAILHGKMKPKEKDEVMRQFAQKEIDILISTTVIEVGVNVPNATAILIENAERFGLSQLHQLRGRIGRGNAQSYCIFLNRSDSKTSKERLKTLVESNDGFYIAEEDLKQRGPGDFYGIRQSGELLFILGDIYTDASILKDAMQAVKEINLDDFNLPVTNQTIL